MTPFGALQGVTVVDLTRMLSGPYATMMLADHGARVIKVETFAGDTTRTLGPYMADDELKLFCGYFQSVNRNKESIVVDLHSAAGRKIVQDLCRTADVVVNNFRPGVMQAMGLGFAELKALNPRIILANLSGFGDDPENPSPYRDWPAYDVVAQAMGGVIGITGPDKDTPTKVGPGVGDIFPGALLAFGIVSALLHAFRTGEGQEVEVAMYDAVVALCERAVYQHTFQGVVPGPEGQVHPFVSPFGIFRAADGAVALACQENNYFRELATALEEPGWLADARFATKQSRSAHRVALNALVSARIARSTKAELTKLLGGRVAYGAVQTVDEIVRDPHVAARGLLAEVEQPGAPRKARIVNTPVRLSKTPGGVHRRAPYLGEQTEAVLTAVGYAAPAIDELRRDGVVASFEEADDRDAQPV